MVSMVSELIQIRFVEPTDSLSNHLQISNHLLEILNPWIEGIY